jgi:lipid II:glycine glycyltransferase (peptidoglycan interpeptide bridge formation enzyme)
VEGKLGIIRLVKYEDKIIGGILSPVTPGKTIYEWYVCGLDHEYKTLYPSVLATWSAIEYAVKNGLPYFDFMGVGIPERDYGVRDFKMRFGGERVNYGRFARVNNKWLYLAAEAGYNFMAAMKKI